MLQQAVTSVHSKINISDYSANGILHFSDIMNALPQKIPGHPAPEELFEKSSIKSMPLDDRRSAFFARASPSLHNPNSFYCESLRNS